MAYIIQSLYELCQYSCYTSPMWFLYILKCKDGSLYTGIAKDPEKRFLEHKSGKGATYTRIHKPIKIVYIEKQKTRSLATKRECEIKKWPKTKKTALFSQNL